MIINVLRKWYRTYIRGSGNRHKDAPQFQIDWNAVEYMHPRLIGVDLAEGVERTSDLPMTSQEVQGLLFAHQDPFPALDPKKVPRGTSRDTEIATVIYRPFVNYKPQQRVPQCSSSQRATRTSAATTQAKRRKGKGSGSRR